MDKATGKDSSAKQKITVELPRWHAEVLRRTAEERNTTITAVLELALEAVVHSAAYDSLRQLRGTMWFRRYR